MLAYLTIIGYCLTVASSAILIQDAHIDKSIAIIMGASCGILFYGLLNIKNLGSLMTKIRKNWISVVAINVATASGWLFGYLYGLEYIDAATLFCIEMAVIPIVSFVVSTPFREYSQRIPTLIAILCSVISMGLIIRQNVLSGGHVNSYIIGTCIALMAGIGTAYVGIFSKKLGENHFTSTQILMTRLLFVLLLGLLISIQRNAFTGLTFADIKPALLSGCMAGILTCFLYQKSLDLLGFMVVSTLVPFTPVFAYFIRVYRGNQPFSSFLFVIILICSLTICGMNILMYQRTKNK
ncbi:MAG: EamA family transporter [Bacteroidota bacterium]